MSEMWVLKKTLFFPPLPIHFLWDFVNGCLYSIEKSNGTWQSYVAIHIFYIEKGKRIKKRLNSNDLITKIN